MSFKLGLPTAAPVKKGSTTGGYDSTQEQPVGGRSTPSDITVHKNIDGTQNASIPIKSSADGIVTYAQGSQVTIKNKDGETSYSNLTTTSVKVGDRVVRGEVIGVQGGPAIPPYQEKPQPKTIVDPAAPAAPPAGPGDSQFSRPATKEDQQAARAAAAIKGFDQNAILEALRSGDHFYPNVVNSFDNLTYHWRLFVLPDKDYLSGITVESTNIMDFYKSIEGYTQVTIAESGVTAYSIDEVTINANVGPNFQTASTSVTGFNMKITEPNGINFLDSLRKSATSVGIYNYAKALYYVELTFKGYDYDGQINLSPFGDAFPNGGRWVWAVQINNIETSLTAGGGTYTLEMVHSNNIAQFEMYNVVPSLLHVSGDTLGTWWTNFCNSLNEDWKLRTFSKTPDIVKFDVEFHPVDDLFTKDQVAALSIIPSKVDFNPETNNDEDDHTGGVIPQGSTMPVVLDTVMQACEEIQKYAKDSVADVDSPDDSNTKINGKGFRSTLLWRLQTEVRLPDYDPLLQQYFHHITFHIFGYYTHATVLSTQDDATNTQDAQKARLALMAKKNFLRKKYEYIFTGENTEVLNMNLNFNMAWSAQLPRLAEADKDQAETHARHNPDAGASGANGNDTPRDEKTTSTGDILAAQQERADTLREKKEEFLKAQLEVPDAAQVAKIAQLAAEVTALEDQVARGSDRTELLRENMRSAQDHSVPEKTGKKLFGEDIIKETSEPEKRITPISIEIVDKGTANGIRGQYHPGKSLYGAALNQTFGVVSAQFQTIEIEVRGDPYWIGPGSFEDTLFIRSNTFSEKYPNYSAGCNTFLFRLKYPLGSDDNGNVILNTNESVTGVYQVNSVTHKFIDGKFTQTLSATYVYLIETYKALWGQETPTETSVKE